MNQVHRVDPMLLDIAEWRLADRLTKSAFTPMDALNGAGGGGAPPGGAPPADPSMGGGAPPMDPSMGGGAPPMDPSMGGAPPAGGGGIDPASLQMIVQQAVQQAMGGGGAAGPGQAGPAGPGKGAKVDPGMIYLELGRVRKLLTTLFQNLNMNLPPDILDDQMVAQSATGQTPTSQPLPGGDAGGGGGVSLPAIGQSPAINPMAPADMGKQGSVKDMFLRRSGVDGLFQNLELAARLLQCRNGQ